MTILCKLLGSFEFEKLNNATIFLIINKSNNKIPPTA